MNTIAAITAMLVTTIGGFPSHTADTGKVPEAPAPVEQAALTTEVSMSSSSSTPPNISRPRPLFVRTVMKDLRTYEDGSVTYRIVTIFPGGKNHSVTIGACGYPAMGCRAASKPFIIR